MAKYVPIRVSNLRGDLKIPFNAYVRVAGKYILLCRQGDSFEGQRLERLKSKKLQKMFIPEAEAAAFDAYIKENMERAYDVSPARPIEIRTQIIHGSLQTIAEDLMEETDNSDVYRVATEGAKKFNQFLSAEPGALKSLLEIKNVDYSAAHHGVIVAALSLAIAEEMKLAEARPMQMESLAVGALLHDVDHFYNNIDLTVHPDTLAGSARIIYQKHAFNGAERLANQSFYDPVVIDIIKHHDEKLDGSGPLKVREKELDPFCMVVAAANHFDHYILYDNMPAKDALKRILIDKMGVVSLDYLKALQEALKKRQII
jgi:putative nucleotidyltransferase with HDIG domain